jgi:hypothetical protein
LKNRIPYISAFGRHVPIITLAIYTIFMGFSSMMIWLWTRLPM